jgi:hydrogenase expression/formation protein HypD
MKFVDEFRDSAAARRLLAEIRRRVTRPWVLMEVCGGQTHSLLRHGIEAELEGVVELIHGPGCPVCVTAVEAIDFAQQLALQPAVMLVSFGDMLRVPGSRDSLLGVRANGGNVGIVYSPFDAVELARRNPDQQVVFFAVGFETTAPATALAVLQADRLRLDNFSLLVSHVRVQPAMEAVMRAPANRVLGFLAAGHVCTVVGYRSYDEFVRRFRVPVVVTGFEPVDLLDGILECVSQLETGHFNVANRYGRSARPQGNSEALSVVDRVYSIADSTWRGLGLLPAGGYVLREEFARFDATRRFAAMWIRSSPSPHGRDECRAADVLSGVIRPTQCPEFGIRCTPDTPLGAPMVSTEGACAAYYRYARRLEHVSS